MIKKASVGARLFTILNYTFLALFALSTYYPFHYALIRAFNDGWDAIRGGLFLLPRVFTFDNIEQAFKDKVIYNAIGISALRTIIGTVLDVALTAMVAYALSRKDLPGKRGITFYFMLTTIFYGGFIPFFLLLKSLGFTNNNFMIYIIPNIFCFLYIVYMRSYFETLPSELRESAIIDGAGEFRIFTSIYIPLSLPMIATIGLFYGVNHWNDWFTGAYYVSNPRMKPAATILYQIMQQYNYGQSSASFQRAIAGAGETVRATTPDSINMAFMILITLPIVCVYPFLQKYFVKGLTLGAVKE